MNSSISNATYFRMDTLLITLSPISIAILIFFLILSAIIFSYNEFKSNPIYKYLQANSIIDSILLVFFIIYMPILSNQFLKDKTLFMYLDGIIRLYFLRVFKMMSLLVSLTTTINRYLSLIGSKIMNGKLVYKTIMIFIILFSIIYNLPSLSLVQYKDEKLEIIVIIMQLAINLIPLCLTSFLNILLVYKLKANNSNNNFKKRNLHHSSYFLLIRRNAFRMNGNNMKNPRLKNMSLKLTLMIIWLSMVFILDQFVYLITRIQFFFTDPKSNRLTRSIALPMSILLVICNGLNIFIYYKFNRLFAFHFKRLMGCSMCLICNFFKKHPF
jgi:hypothetical protein